jgi:hypothetical protein
MQSLTLSTHTLLILWLPLRNCCVTWLESCAPTITAQSSGQNDKHVWCSYLKSCPVKNQSHYLTGTLCIPHVWLFVFDEWWYMILLYASQYALICINCTCVCSASVFSRRRVNSTDLPDAAISGIRCHRFRSLHCTYLSVYSLTTVASLLLVLWGIICMYAYFQNV